MVSDWLFGKQFAEEFDQLQEVLEEKEGMLRLRYNYKLAQTSILFAS